MKVLHLLDTDGFAGTERHLIDLASAQRACGVSLTIACKADSKLWLQATQSGLDVAPILSAKLLKNCLAVRKLMSKQPFDVVHAHNGRTMLMAATPFRTRVARIATQHFIEPQHTTYRGFKRWVANVAHRRVNARMDRFIAVSEAVRSSMIQREGLDPADVITILNGINPPKPTRLADAVRAEFQVCSTDLLVVTVARLEPEKGIDRLLVAVPTILDRHPNAVFLLVGDGSLSHSLKSQAASLGLAAGSRVKFAGFRHDAADLIAAADLFLLPSPAEPFGLVLLEAMSLAKAVVAVRAGGPAEIVLDGITGRLATSPDPSCIASSVITMLDDHSVCSAMGASGERLFCDKFTAKIMATRTAEVYFAALSSRHM